MIFRVFLNLFLAVSIYELSYTVEPRPHPKMRRLSGHSWELVAHKKRTTRGSMQFYVVTSSIIHTANIKIEQYVRWSLTKD